MKKILRAKQRWKYDLQSFHTYTTFLPKSVWKQPVENQTKGTNLNFGLLLLCYCVEHPVSSLIMIDMHRVYVFKVILLSLCHWKLNNWNVFYENKYTFSNIQVLKVWNLFRGKLFCGLCHLLIAKYVDDIYFKELDTAKAYSKTRKRTMGLF